jgi:CRP-like cAMP-binding protein
VLHGATLPADAADDYHSGNRLLDALPARDRADLLADLTIVTIEAHRHTHGVGDVMQYVDFPIDAVLSVVATFKDGDSVEVGTVGNEGFVEYDAVLHSPRSQRSSFCQVRGTIGRMPIERFASRMANSEAFSRRMHLNVRAALFSAQQFAACNGKHSVIQRCARWLAMTADRVGGPGFKLTHEFLAIMLGVRRASVSEAMEAIGRTGAISYTRGNVRVLDVELLRGSACECYGFCAAAFTTSLLE